jgi:hypothetical protein
LGRWRAVMLLTHPPLAVSKRTGKRFLDRFCGFSQEIVSYLTRL